MNDLVRTLDPQKFKFIAVDDEPEDVVTSFLAKRTIASMVALDESGAIFRAFHVSSRPATIVIDPKGNIALVTKPEDLTVTKLKAIASGIAPLEQPKRSTSQEAVSPSNEAASEEVKHQGEPQHSSYSEEPLAEIELRRKLPAEGTFSVEHKDEDESLIGWSSRSLIAIALNAPEHDIEFQDEPPSGSFDLIVKTGPLGEDVRQTLVKAVIMKGFRVTAVKKLTPSDALILTHSDQVPLRLQPTINEHLSASITSHDGTSTFVNFTGDRLARVIGEKYGVHVVNETGLKGGFDGTIQWPTQAADLSSALRATTGLEVSHEVREIATYVVSNEGSGHAKVEP